ICTFCQPVMLLYISCLVFSSLSCNSAKVALMSTFVLSATWFTLSICISKSAMGFSKSNVVSIHAVLQKSAAKLGNCLDYLKMSDDDGQKTTASIGNGLVFASISFGQLNYTFRLHLWSDLLLYLFWFRVFPLLMSRRKPIRV